MAEQLTDFTFPTRTGTAKYPWSEWTDGTTWRLTKDQDYETKNESMVSLLRNKAKQNGSKVKVYVPDPEHIIFQFVAKATTTRNPF